MQSHTTQDYATQELLNVTIWDLSTNRVWEETHLFEKSEWDISYGEIAELISLGKHQVVCKYERTGIEV